MNAPSPVINEGRIIAVSPDFYPPVLQQLSDRHLPVLPHGAQDLLTQLNNDAADFDSIASTLENFPTIVARLISLANSAWSAPQAEITSLTMACSRLGLNVVRSTSIALAVAAPFNLFHCPQFDARRYWSSAMCSAEISTGLAKLIPDYSSIQKIRTCGLLHNLGLLWLADQLPVLTQQSIQRRQQEDNLSLDQSLYDIIGAGYTQAGAFLAGLWELPEVFQTVMAFHRSDQTPPDHALEVEIISCAGMFHRMASRHELDSHGIDSQQTQEAKELEAEMLQLGKTVATRLGIDQAAMELMITRLGRDIERCDSLANTLFG